MYNKSKNVGSARFQELDGLRQDWLADVREASALTKPKVFPPTGYIPDARLPMAWQSHGNRLVSNVVSQLLLILFPPNMPFFHLDISDLDTKQLARNTSVDDSGKSQFDMMREAFIILENASAMKFETLGFREKVRRILSQLVIGGSTCFAAFPDGNLRVYPVEDWVCRRDSDGHLIELLTRDFVSRETGEQEYFDGAPEDADEVTVITHSTFNGKSWEVVSYGFGDTIVRQTTFTKDTFPFNCPYWELFNKDNYGYGLVAENIADIRTLETGTQILTESSQSIAKLLYLVSPNGTVTAKDIADAPNGGIISGEAEDVTTLAAHKTYDLQGFNNLLVQIRRDLDVSFMMASVIRRDAERVTAEEIRRMAIEFEKAKGGVYSGLSANIQSPIARTLLSYVLKHTKLVGNAINLKTVVPIISAGLEGLGRNLELDNLKGYVADVLAIHGEAQLDMRKVVERMASLRNIVAGDLLLSATQVSQNIQQDQANQLANRVAPQVVKTLGDKTNNG